MKLFHFLCLFAIVSFVLLENNGTEAKRYKKKLKYCKLDLFMECLMEPLSYFTHQVNGSGIANSEEEMEQFCFNLHDYFPVCAKQWSQRCGSPIHTELMMKLVVEPFRQSFRDFCDSKGPIRPEFLKYSNCLIHEVKLSPAYRKECIRPLQAGQEFIFEQAKASLNISEAVTSFCCSYNQWENCIVDHLTRNCGQPSAQVFPNLIHHGSMMILKGLCPPNRYDPENVAQCDKAKFNAPLEYKPKGLKSLSIASYLFSYSCPNVGWGIIDKRDF